MQEGERYLRIDLLGLPPLVFDHVRKCCLTEDEVRQLMQTSGKLCQSREAVVVSMSDYRRPKSEFAPKP